ncbi:hypothetical protein TrST_g2986 [Triparma strigata]|uniref:Uncharacterized protein n=1 Tax=Triparma strigata TaxID=1606541 RepID=A0A9W7DYE1_9STRA|nr:hypothetical protein TrST_g2986 [Triparma strigata]
MYNHEEKAFLKKFFWIAGMKVVQFVTVLLSKNGIVENLVCVRTAASSTVLVATNLCSFDAFKNPNLVVGVKGGSKKKIAKKSDDEIAKIKEIKTNPKHKSIIRTPPSLHSVPVSELAKRYDKEKTAQL